MKTMTSPPLHINELARPVNISHLHYIRTAASHTLAQQLLARPWVCPKSRFRRDDWIWQLHPEAFGRITGKAAWRQFIEAPSDHMYLLDDLAEYLPAAVKRAMDDRTLIRDTPWFTWEDGWSGVTLQLRVTTTLHETGTSRSRLLYATTEWDGWPRMASVLLAMRALGWDYDWRGLQNLLIAEAAR